jgi:TonB-linked SusC/RagA family outer membrane protein
MRMATVSSFPSLISESVFRSVAPHRTLLATFAALLSVAASPVAAQEGHLVSGRVVDAVDGRTLPGVNIVVKGTMIGTATRLNGTFSLRAPSPNDTLAMSYIGYKRTEIPIEGRDNIDITLERGAIPLDAVVVTVPYGEQTVATITGSVSAISGEALDRIPTTNLSQSLQGTVPGLIGVNPSGRPGRDNSNLLIRGRSTLNNSDPLVVIDGVPDRQGGLARLNPGDIESISVLKDASASIYGSRAANGVILVTTKQGRAGAPRVSLNVERGWARPAVVPEMADAATYMQMLNEIDVSRGNPQRYSAEQIECHRTEADLWECPNTDWYKEGLKDAAQEVTAQASVTGGSENVRYRLSAEGVTENGILVNNADGYDQLGFRSNIDGNITDKLRLSVNLHGRYENRDLAAWTRENTNNPTGNAAWELLQRGKPNEPAFWPNGLPGPDQENGVNPVVSSETGYDNDKTYYFQSNVTLTLEVPGVEGWTVDGTVAYDRSFWNRKRWQKPWTLYDYVGRDANGEPIVIGALEGPAEPSLRQQSVNETDVLLRATTRYERTFGGSHNTTLLLGTEWQKGSWDSLHAFRGFFPTDEVDLLFAGGTQQQELGAWAAHDARLNIFGRLNYNYRQKYLLELVARYDGSYIFPKGNRFGFFPSISAGWRLDQEGWFNNLAGNVFDRLKLRASYGQTGNDQIEAYQFLSTFVFNGQYGFGDGLGTRISPTRVANPSVTWEVAKQFDVGLQGAILGDRLAFDFTYFRHNRDDILWWRNEAVPQTAGFSLPRENIARMSNRGFEGEVSFSQRLSDNATLRAGANITFAQDRVEDFAEAAGVLPWQRNTGRQWRCPTGSPADCPTTGLYYVADGIFHTWADTVYPHLAGARPGDIRFVDVNRDGKIDGADRVRMDENDVPDIIGAFNVGATIGRFDLFVLFQGATQVLQYVRAGSVGEFGNFFKEDADKRWTPENPNAEGPRAWNRVEPYWANVDNTYFLRDAKYLRLKTASIAFTVPPAWLQRFGRMESLQLYLTGRNLLTWSPLKIMDPEVRNQAAHEYPPERSFTVGLRMGL